MNPMANFYANIYNTYYKSFIIQSKIFLTSLQVSNPSTSPSFASRNERPFLKGKNYETKKKINMKELLSHV